MFYTSLYHSLAEAGIWLFKESMIQCFRTILGTRIINLNCWLKYLIHFPTCAFVLDVYKETTAQFAFQHFTSNNGNWECKCFSVPDCLCPACHVLSQCKVVVLWYFVPQIVLYEDRNFQGRSYECKGELSDLHSYLNRCNSARVKGGFWVLYERQNYMGYQYVLAPGEYPDYHHWIGFNDCVRSCRPIRHVCLSHLCVLLNLITNTLSVFREWPQSNNSFTMCVLLHSLQITGHLKLKLFERPNFDGQAWEVTESTPSIQERFLCREIHSCKVHEGPCVFFEHPNYRGRQYLLEKGEYRRHTEWGAMHPTVGSVRQMTTDC